MCAYVLGNLRGKILEDLTIRAEVTDLVVYEGSRPRKASEFGAIPDQIELLNNKVAGKKIESPVRLGVGVVMEIEIGKIFLIDTFNGHFVRRVEKKFSISFKDEREKVLIGLWRDLDAAKFTQTFSCLDTASGVLEDQNFLLGAYREALEIQFYNSEGWGRYLLPKSLSGFQESVSMEQKKIWSALNETRTEKLEPRSEVLLSVPMFPGRMDIVEIGGQKVPAILAGEPEAGSFEIILVVEPQLPGGNWSISDGELSRDGSWLNRSVHLVFRRLPAPPLMVRLGSNGICDFGIALEGENLDLCLNQKSRATLTRLGYL